MNCRCVFWCSALLLSVITTSKIHAEFMADENEVSSKVISYLLIRDFEGAKQWCETALKIFPDSEQLKGLLIRTLAESGRCEEAVKVFKEERAGKELIENFDLLESLSWGVLAKKHKDSELGAISGLIGAYLTHDARAVTLLCDALRSTNAYMRAIAVQLSSHYHDRILQREILRLLREEKNWFVRAEVMNAIGEMRIFEAVSDLNEIVASRSVGVEEKQGAIQSLVMLHEGVSKQKIVELVKSSRAGFRELAISLLDHFERSDLIDEVLFLLGDSSPYVRIRLLAFLGSMNFDAQVYKTIRSQIETLSLDINPEIAIMANWVLLRIEPDLARQRLQEWTLSKDTKAARFAATVVGAGGMLTLPILNECFTKAEDKYVKANLALKMVEQGVQISRAGSYLRAILFDSKEKLMITSGIYPCFSQILPSNVRHAPHIARYPEIVDQLSRLKLLNTLAIVGVSDLKPIAKAYLQGQVWGVVGSAALFFLEEADMASVDLVKELLDDEDHTVRIQAALALAMYGGEKKVAKVLEEAYWKVDYEKKISILEAIGRIGSRDSIEFLLKVLEEPFTLPRTIAASSIIQCLYH